MSSQSSAFPRRGLTERQAQTVERIYQAASDELDEVGYDELTVRSVAARAGVSFATAYTYFASKEHLCAALYWRRLAAVPWVTSDLSGGDRLRQELRQIAEFLAAAPALAVAASKCLLGPDGEVEDIRMRIGAMLVERFQAALGDGAPPRLLSTLGYVFTGAVVQAGMGVISYDALADELAASATMLLGDVAQ